MASLEDMVGWERLQSMRLNGSRCKVDWLFVEHRLRNHFKRALFLSESNDLHIKILTNYFNTTNIGSIYKTKVFNEMHQLVRDGAHHP